MSYRLTNEGLLGWCWEATEITEQLNLKNKWNCFPKKTNTKLVGLLLLLSGTLSVTERGWEETHGYKTASRALCLLPWILSTWLESTISYLCWVFMVLLTEVEEPPWMGVALPNSNPDKIKSQRKDFRSIAFECPWEVHPPYCCYCCCVHWRQNLF